MKVMPFAFSGAVPKSEWVLLPNEAAIRLRTTPFGIHRSGAMALSTDLGTLWQINDGDRNEYFLSGTFTIDPAADCIPPGDGYLWRGTLVLPAVKIVNPHE